MFAAGGGVSRHCATTDAFFSEQQTLQEHMLAEFGVGRRAVLQPEPHSSSFLVALLMVDTSNRQIS